MICLRRGSRGDIFCCGPIVVLCVICFGSGFSKWLPVQYDKGKKILELSPAAWGASQMPLRKNGT